MKSPREAYKVFAWTAFPLGGKTGRLYHPFITFHIIFMEPQSQHQRRRPRIVAAIQTGRQNPAPETQGRASGSRPARGTWPEHTAREQAGAGGGPGAVVTPVKTEAVSDAPRILSRHTPADREGVEREQNAEAEPSTPGAGQRVGPSASAAEAAAPGRTASAAGHTHCVTVKRQSSEPGLGPRRIQTCARPLLGRMMAGESFPPFRPQGPRRREEDANITTQR